MGKGYNNQSGTHLVEGRIEGLSKLRSAEYERDYQDALSYRHRLVTGELSLAEQTKTVLLGHFDKLARSATAWRGIAIAGKR